MNAEDAAWWLYLPPCPRCQQCHILLDCTQRLPMEVSEEGR